MQTQSHPSPHQSPTETTPDPAGPEEGGAAPTPPVSPTEPLPEIDGEAPAPDISGISEQHRISRNRS